MKEKNEQKEECKSIATVEILGHEMNVYESDGERWVTVVQLACALGYDESRTLRKLIKRHSEEFDNKIKGVKLTPTDSQDIWVINYHGVLRSAMLTKTDRGSKFRDEAEKILYRVMVNGDLLVSKEDAVELHRIAAQPNTGIDVVALTEAIAPVIASTVSAAIGQVIEQVNSTIEAKFSQVYVPANEDNSFWPTPTERLRVLVNHIDIPERFNSGGSFDVFASKRHGHVRGGLLSQRDRSKRGKNPDYVIQPNPQNDEFIKETFKIWIKENAARQAKLALILNRPKKEPLQ